MVSMRNGGIDSRENVMHNVVLDDAVENVASDEAEFAVNS
jgi:hypothetical protein